MALMTCKDCGMLVSDQAPTCPKCGRPAYGAARGGRGDRTVFGRNAPAAGIAAFLLGVGLMILGKILQKAIKARSSRSW